MRVDYDLMRAAEALSINIRTFRRRLEDTVGDGFLDEQRALFEAETALDSVVYWQRQESGR